VHAVSLLNASEDEVANVEDEVANVEGGLLNIAIVVAT
jgi:hypothetical protein